MEKLTKEEVLHVANLARLELIDDEIDEYAIKLKEILDEVDKIKDVDVEDCNRLISPNDNICALRDDKAEDMLSVDDVLLNAPKKMADYIEVGGVFE